MLSPQPAGAYFGGFPLLFAVCCNRKDMVARILATQPQKGESICNAPTLCDQHGNSALHLAVLHELPEMYAYFHELSARQVVDLW